MNRVASALLNTAQQIGAVLGLAVMATVSTTAADQRLPDAARVAEQATAVGDGPLVAAAGDALTHGYTTAFLVGAGLLLVAAVVITATVTTIRTQREPEVQASRSSTG